MVNIMTSVANVNDDEQIFMLKQNLIDLVEICNDLMSDQDSFLKLSGEFQDACDEIIDLSAKELRVLFDPLIENTSESSLDPASVQAIAKAIEEANCGAMSDLGLTQRQIELFGKYKKVICDVLQGYNVRYT